ncbi:putative ribonuclease H-like domain-containing protein [Tanacetum coccineum]|uniref:Ribonuclease H-like domain-containing protein n=1 Tax=Tanacetum coccineum TaxID=301880 RepID=A0ABQ5E757_9ASTR
MATSSAPRAWYATLSTFLEKHGYRRGTIDKTLFIKKDKKDIILVQIYVDDIIFGSTKKIVRVMKFEDLNERGVTPMETKAPLAQDEGGPDVDLHLYRSMIGCLMYLTASRPDIIDYAAANLDRKSTTGGCQFLGRRLISWQCKKQTIVATSTTKAEYVAAALLWSSAMAAKSIIGLWDCYEKKLIQVQKIHTDLNVADLLTKAFDGPRYYLELERMLQAQLGHEKGHASCHLLIGCRLVVSNDVVVNLL